MRDSLDRLNFIPNGPEFRLQVCNLGGTYFSSFQSTTTLIAAMTTAYRGQAPHIASNMW